MSTVAPKKALITGITGQDGSYLAELLLDKGYEVHGIKRRGSSFNTQRIDHIFETNAEYCTRFKLHFGDLSDSTALLNIMRRVEPDEVYNLGAQSHVGVSFENPIYTADIVAIGSLRLLEAIRALDLTNRTRYYQASSSELYGLVQEVPQNEKTPFYPRSPYGVSKLFAYWITQNYRESYGLYACNGILFNHESPRRGETFVTRKISRGISEIVLGSELPLYLGNLNSLRDWGHAKDYVEMQWLMLQQKTPKDYVIATGVQHSVRQFVSWVCESIGFTVEFFGSGPNEVGKVKEIIDKRCKNLSPGQTIIVVDEKYFRPTEVDSLLGNPDLACTELGWQPKYTARQLADEMVKADYEYFSKLRGVE